MGFVAKKLLNDPKRSVVEAIDGLLEQAPHLNKLDGFPGIKVIVNTNHDPSSQVAVVSGGGSGHEPMPSGFVGDGLLAAAVCGEVFASPSVEAVLAAIHAVTGPAGCCLIVNNYTGDRLNFGLAAEKAKAAGLAVEVVWVGEDCALPTSGASGPGRRGLAGCILVHKIAGAAAAAGQPLAAVTAAAEAAVASMGTIGAALSAATLPGAQLSDRLGPEEMELGMGLHGEPGARKCGLLTADDAVAAMMAILMDPANAYLTVPRGAKIALLVNSLGATPPLELSVVARAALAYCRGTLGANVVRLYCGPLCTSFDMAGVSLTLLLADEERLALLDAATNAPAWPAGSHVVVEGKVPLPLPAAVAPLPPPPAAACEAATPGARAARAAILAAAGALEGAAGRLNELDAKVGDGDCGSTLALGAAELRAALAAARLPLADPPALADAFAHACRAMGGTSGALYEILFTVAAGALRGAAQPASLPALAAAFSEGVAAVQRYGRAAPGSRTMVDALVPAAEALSVAVAAGSDAATALRLAAAAATTGAEQTKDMHALAGRSSYVPNAQLHGVPDPGAEGVAVWLTAVAAALADAH